MVVESEGYISLIEYLVESLGLFESQQQNDGEETIEDLVSGRVASNLMAICEQNPSSTPRCVSPSCRRPTPWSPTWKRCSLPSGCAPRPRNRKPSSSSLSISSRTCSTAPSADLPSGSPAQRKISEQQIRKRAALVGSPACYHFQPASAFIHQAVIKARNVSGLCIRSLDAT